MPCGLACSIAAELGIEYTAGSCVKCRKLDVAALRFETLSGAEVKRSGWYGRAEYNVGAGEGETGTGALDETRGDSAGR